MAEDTGSLTRAARGPRERLVRSALELVGRQGPSGTGLRAVVERAGAPRGSLQHYFPAGKHQLVSEALELAGRAGARSARAAHPADRPSDVLTALVETWRRWLTDSQFATGCPVMATVVDASHADAQLRQTAADAFAHWQGAVADELTTAGVEPARAASLAGVVLAALEGAILVCRLRRGTEPLDDLLATLAPVLDAAT
ncbi:MAG: TetR/AcrR family transcriptional regulator [Angustibacter sp.]